MSNENTQVIQQRQDRDMEFIPFGAADKIKLSVKIIQNLVAVPTKTGKTCSEKDAMRFMMLCQAQRLNPFAGDAHLVGYDTQNGPSFSLITAHQAFLKRAESSEHYDGMESGVIILAADGAILEREGDFHLPNEKVVGGWAKVYHKKHTKPTYRRIRMERFNKGRAQWNEDPAGMIVKCSEADALRSTFPTLLGGLYLREELEANGEHQTQKLKVSTPMFSDVKSDPPQELETKPQTEDAAEPITKLRNLCTESKVKEGQVLSYLEGLGSVKGCQTFEEADEQNPHIIRVATEQFGEIASKISAAK